MPPLIRLNLPPLSAWLGKLRFVNLTSISRVSFDSEPYAFPMIRKLFLLFVTFVSSCEPSALFAQNGIGMRHRHAWGRCQPGAWKQVRVTTETFDDRGQVATSSVTETFTVLESVSDQDYTLRIEVTVDVGGKRFAAQPQVAKLGFNGETEGQKVTTRKVGDGSVALNGRVIPCETHEVVVNGGETKRVSLLQLSDKIAPFVLKRDTNVTDVAGKPTAFQTQVEVVAIDMPYKVMQDVKSTSFLKTVQKQPRGSAVTIEVHCDEVPGGVVAHTSREDDDKGKTTRRSTLELVDYGRMMVENDANAVGRRRVLQRGRGRMSAQPDRLIRE